MDYKLRDLISLSLASSAQWMPGSNNMDSNPKAGYSDHYTPVTRQTPFHCHQLIFFFFSVGNKNQKQTKQH